MKTTKMKNHIIEKFSDCYSEKESEKGRMRWVFFYIKKVIIKFKERGSIRMEDDVLSITTMWQMTRQMSGKNTIYLQDMNSVNPLASFYS